MEKKPGTTNILLCGIGGQGILTMAEVICLVAARDGFHVKKSEVHGMAQRGGSVESHVRFGSEVFSPLIPAAQVDFLVCLHPQEHERMKGGLASGGTDLYEYLSAAKKISEDPRFLNSAMLGILAGHVELKYESWESVFNIVFANKMLHENLGAFRKGVGLAKNK